MKRINLLSAEVEKKLRQKSGWSTVLEKNFPRVLAAVFVAEIVIFSGIHLTKVLDIKSLEKAVERVEGETAIARDKTEKENRRG